jgi:flagellar basal-body rod protein FlgG
MQASMYSSLFGALTQQHRLDVIANNLANADTTGFKKDALAFRNTFRMYAHDMTNPNPSIENEIPWPKSEQLSMTRIGRHHVDHTQGALRRTENPLDLALNGQGFFKVQTNEGTFYTRNGQFQVNAQGRISSPSGALLLGTGGPITVDPDALIQVDDNGAMYADGELVGEIQVVAFADHEILEKVGSNLYRIRPEARTAAAELPAEGTMVEQGTLEASNVEVVREMVDMIETLRIFEACQKSMQDSLQNDQKVMSDVGRTR